MYKDYLSKKSSDREKGKGVVSQHLKEKFPYTCNDLLAFGQLLDRFLSPTCACSHHCAPRIELLILFPLLQSDLI